MHKFNEKEKRNMNIDHDLKMRLAILSTLVRDAPVKPGRTALMKFAYLLQTIKHVPLGYRFELYNYGPYDSTVLSDLSQAVTMKAVKSATLKYPSGYGYEYTSNEKGHAALCEKAADDLAKHDADIKWVLDEFGNESASRLELISTIVYAEREMKRKRQKCSENTLCRRVKAIKPHFSDDKITETIGELAAKNFVSFS